MPPIAAVSFGENVPPELRTPNYRSSQLEGIGYNSAIDRQDPSNVIKAGNKFYVWYSQRQAGAPPFASTIYYATSNDGRRWTPHDEALGKGAPGSWDSYGVITPYVAMVSGKFYLFYTGSASDRQGPLRPETRNLGLAVAASPDGPFRRISSRPVLSPGHGDAWDSLLVDDAHMIIRGSRCWLYYKGGGRGVTAQTTKWGLAIAEHPAGPYAKYPANPVLRSGHTVCVWPHRGGVAALVDNAGPERFTVQWAPDGIHFRRAAKLRFVHTGCGPYDPDAHSGAPTGRGITWGVAQERRNGHVYIIRFDVDLAVPGGGM